MREMFFRRDKSLIARVGEMVGWTRTTTDRKFHDSSPLGYSFRLGRQKATSIIAFYYLMQIDSKL